jgi:hypothetical protein
MKVMQVLLIAWTIKSFIVFGVKKSFILYGCKCDVIYACTLKPYDFLKVCEKHNFYAVCAIQVFIFNSLDSYDSKLQSLSMFYLNQHSAAGKLQLPFFQLVLQSRTFPLVLNSYPLRIYYAKYVSHNHGHSYDKTVLSKLVSGFKL